MGVLGLKKRLHELPSNENQSSEIERAINRDNEAVPYGFFYF